jgi:hypothetical protein
MIRRLMISRLMISRLMIAQLMIAQLMIAHLMIIAQLMIAHLMIIGRLMIAHLMTVRLMMAATDPLMVRLVSAAPVMMASSSSSSAPLRGLARPVQPEGFAGVAHRLAGPRGKDPLGLVGVRELEETVAEGEAGALVADDASPDEGLAGDGEQLEATHKQAHTHTHMIRNDRIKL